MTTKAFSALESFAAALLEAAGASSSNAKSVADSLVLSNRYGVDTHGVSNIPNYVRQMRAGQLCGDASPELVQDHGSGLLIKGHWTFGQVTAKLATDLGVERAKKHGIAIVGCVQLMHTGRLGEFAERAAAAGCVSLMFTGGLGKNKPAAVPYGGSKPVLHTNPVTLGMPGGAEPPIVVDIATTGAAGLKIEYAARTGKSLPEKWIVDAAGNPTDDPNEFAKGGAHLPFGGHKGYGLMVTCEVLGRILTGADHYVEAGRSNPVLSNCGFSYIMIRSDLFTTPDAYSSETDTLERTIRNVPPAPGFDRVMVPGDLERGQMQQRDAEGIVVPDKIWSEIVTVAESLSVAVPEDLVS